jgi:hypothetical protein
MKETMKKNAVLGKYVKMIMFVFVAQFCTVVESFSVNGNDVKQPRGMPQYNDGTAYALENTDIQNILKQNKEYVNSMGQEFFDDLGSKHQPKYMWIGCADARAPANELMVRI